MGIINDAITSASDMLNDQQLKDDVVANVRKLMQLPGNALDEINSRASGASSWVDHLASIPKSADDSAEKAFPGSARDSSVKNAYRHSLGSGLLARELGAGDGGVRGSIAQALAKGVGYGWELLGARENIQNPKHWLDTKHDLNANAVGIETAGWAKSDADLADQLKKKALQSAPVQPPGPFESSPGYLTHTER